MNDDILTDNLMRLAKIFQDQQVSPTGFRAGIETLLENRDERMIDSTFTAMAVLDRLLVSR